MTGNSAGHMCNRCSGHRDAATLCLRSPDQELLAGVSVFLGLSGLTVSMLTAEHVDMSWVPVSHYLSWEWAGVAG